MRRSLGPILAALLVLGLGFGALERGNRHFRAGRYAEAVEAYREALEDGDDSARLHYNLGTALLALQRYEEAGRHLDRALAGAEPALRKRAYYNLGNRFLTEARGPAAGERATALLDAAVQAYKEALRLDPRDADAKWNLELALREQEEQQGGGGGAEEEEDQGGGGGGGTGQPSPEAPPSPAPQAGEERPAPLSPDQAERILSAAEEDERGLFREKLKSAPRQAQPVLRDW